MKRTTVSLVTMLALLLGLCLGTPALSEDDALPPHLEAIGFQAQGYPIVTEPLTLTVVGVTNPASMGGAEEWAKNSFWVRMEEMTGVKIEFKQVIATDSWGEIKSILMASGDLPDMFFQVNFTKQEEQKYGSQGLFMDMSPYINETYMPELMSLDAQYQSILKEIITPSGAIYTLPEITAQLSKRARENIVVNEYWCEVLGIGLPTDTESFYEMLKAFRDGDPNQNSLQDEIPMSVAGITGLSGMGVLNKLMTMFGYIYGENGMFADDANEHMVYVPVTEEYKEFLKYFHTLYAEGLLDPDSFTQSNNDLKAKGSTEVPQLGVFYNNSPRTIVDGLSQRFPDGDIANVDQIRMQDYTFVVLKAENGEQYCPNNSNLCTTGRFVMSSTCEYPEVVARWMDYLYTQEGGEAVWMGKQGVDFDIVDDVVVWMDNGTPVSDDKMQDVRAKAAVQSNGNQPGIRPDACLLMEPELLAVQSSVSEYIRVAMPSFYFMEDEVTQVSQLSADLNPYIEQFAANVIVGNTDIDAQWDTFVATLEAMGYPRLLEIYQGCLDRYMGR